jgi:serine/threonine-protein kinase
LANFRWVSLGLLVGLAIAPLARAQSAADKAAAEALFDEGKRLRDQKRYAEACPKLADSQRLDPAVGTLLNLALCYKEAGQTASAWSTYREAAAQAAAAHQADREQLARDEAAALETKLTKLVIEVAPEVAKIPGVEVKRDGAVVPQGLWGVAAPVDPGVRSIDVTAPGKKPLHMDAKAEGAGATAKVVVSALEDDPHAAVAGTVAPAAPMTQPQSPAAQPDDRGAKAGQTQRILGFVVGGLGIVGLGVGGVFSLKSMSENDEALDICADETEPCTADDIDDHDHLVDQAKASQLNSYVAYGLGTVGVVTGVVLVLTAPSGEKKTSRLRVTPELALGHVGLNVSGAW